MNKKKNHNQENQQQKLDQKNIQKNSSNNKYIYIQKQNQNLQAFPDKLNKQQGNLRKLIIKRIDLPLQTILNEENEDDEQDSSDQSFIDWDSLTSFNPLLQNKMLEKLGTQPKEEIITKLLNQQQSVNNNNNSFFANTEIKRQEGIPFFIPKPGYQNLQKIHLSSQLKDNEKTVNNITSFSISQRSLKGSFINQNKSVINTNNNNNQNTNYCNNNITKTNTEIDFINNSNINQNKCINSNNNNNNELAVLHYQQNNNNNQYQQQVSTSTSKHKGQSDSIISSSEKLNKESQKDDNNQEILENSNIFFNEKSDSKIILEQKQSNNIDITDLYSSKFIQIEESQMFKSNISEQEQKIKKQISMGLNNETNCYTPGQLQNNLEGSSFLIRPFKEFKIKKKQQSQNWPSILQQVFQSEEQDRKKDEENQKQQQETQKQVQISIKKQSNENQQQVDQQQKEEDLQSQKSIILTKQTIQITNISKENEKEDNNNNKLHNFSLYYSENSIEKQKEEEEWDELKNEIIQTQKEREEMENIQEEMGGGSSSNHQQDISIIDPDVKDDEEDTEQQQQYFIENHHVSNEDICIAPVTTKFQKLVKQESNNTTLYSNNKGSAPTEAYTTITNYHKNNGYLNRQQSLQSQSLFRQSSLSSNNYNFANMQKSSPFKEKSYLIAAHHLSHSKQQPTYNIISNGHLKQQKSVDIHGYIQEGEEFPANKVKPHHRKVQSHQLSKCNVMNNSSLSNSKSRDLQFKSINSQFSQQKLNNSKFRIRNNKGSNNGIIKIE